MPFRRRPAAAPPPPDGTLVDAGAPPPGYGEDPPPGRNLWAWLAAFLILVLAGVAAAYILGQEDDEPEAAGRTTVTSPRLSVPESSTNPDPEETNGETTTGKATTEAQTTTEREDGRVDVPRVVGLRSDAASEKLQEAQLAAQTREVFADRAAGVVVRQRPRPNQEVPEGTRVLLEVSKGPQPQAVPNVTGLPEADAAAALDRAGFTAAVYDVPATDPKGTVVAQNPAAGQEAASGSSVRINVSTGAQEGEETEREPSPTVTVGDYVGQKRKAAAAAIRRAGLRPDPKYVPSSEPRDTVIAQSPKPGATRKRGDGVRINISQGAKPRAAAAVPDVVGTDEQSATDELEAAGFTVEVVQQDTDDPAEDGIVIDQAPAAGQRIPRGSTVTITVGFFVGAG